MKAVNKQIIEINRLYDAIENTKSEKLKNDYIKRIKRLKSELKEYCSYKGYSYQKIIKEAC